MKQVKKKIELSQFLELSMDARWAPDGSIIGQRLSWVGFIVGAFFE